MKKRFHHPKPSENDLVGPQYWRSLDELAESPGFKEYLEREFPEGASELEGVNRRQFLKVMSASFAFAGVGLAGCRRPEKYVLPYSKQPEQVIHGKPLYYASAMPMRKDPVPLVVETHEGRPTKLEGNDLVPGNLGSTSQYAQASILDLYDPDRSQESLRKGAPLKVAARTDLLTSLHDTYLGSKGAGLAFLAESKPSITRHAQLKRLKQSFPKAIWAEYDAIDVSNPEKAAEQIMGKRLRPIYNFSKARRILSLESDFLYSDPNHLEYTKAYSKARGIRNEVESDKEKMNRLYVAESYYSITGGMADHRLRIESSNIPALTALIAASVFKSLGDHEELVDRLEASSKSLALDPQWVDECAADLITHRGHSLVVAGPHQPTEVHALVMALNEALNAQGATVKYVEPLDNDAENIQGLAQSIENGQVSTLVVLEGNPVYNAPADLDWGSLQSKVFGDVIRLGHYYDETSEASTIHLNAAHYLESWGDVVSWTGDILAVQPMILPLFDGISEAEVLEYIISGAKKSAYGIVFDAITGAIPGSQEKDFQRFLHDGYWKSTGFSKASGKLNAEALNTVVDASLFAPRHFSAEHLEVRFIADPSVDDGRFANNGWLQECPDPVTKLTWDNAILVSPKMAEELGIMAPDPTVDIAKNPNAHKRGRQQAHVLTLTLDGKTITAAAHVQPGLPDFTVVLPLGYGRDLVGRVGEGSGFNAYPLRTSDAFWLASGASLEVAGGITNLADTQEHWSMEGRAIIREANVDYFDKHPEFADHMGMESHTPAVFGMVEGPNGEPVKLDDTMPLSKRVMAGAEVKGNSSYVTPSFAGKDGKGGLHQWGMSIDLNVCTGCNACVIACQSENNIPIVGREQVLRGREMQWIRLDRYYSAGPEHPKEKVPENPQVSVQPMTCQHCESAPCESVCPVNATVHDDEGLNVMAYNRCVGTRYCANNCPYKVRRFNFFDWNDRDRDRIYEGPLGPKGMDELLKMSKNPDVTVRMRGVMEKCTYCVQRIQKAKIDQLVEAKDSPNVTVPDGTIKTACQQVCPAEAIVFGDLLDEESEVYQAKQSPRDYSVLGYLNTRPRTTYLARLRNPNPKMPDAKDQPLSHLEYAAKAHPSHEDAGGHGEEMHPDDASHESSTDESHGGH